MWCPSFPTPFRSTEKAVEAEKNMAEKAAKEERQGRWRAVKVRKKTAAIAVETAVIATHKVAEEVTIECFLRPGGGIALRL